MSNLIWFILKVTNLVSASVDLDHLQKEILLPHNVTKDIREKLGHDLSFLCGGSWLRVRLKALPTAPIGVQTSKNHGREHCMLCSSSAKPRKHGKNNWDEGPGQISA